MLEKKNKLSEKELEKIKNYLKDSKKNLQRLKGKK